MRHAHVGENEEHTRTYVGRNGTVVITDTVLNLYDEWGMLWQQRVVDRRVTCQGMSTELADAVALAIGAKDYRRAMGLMNETENEEQTGYHGNDQTQQ